ncbi:NDP-sugar synthase [Ferruginibacter yonginensis]|uniref:NDP-sugar synthase n=1 Tax=Ferruginibacter yonginensis TaxID=1310416 RepID=A0ABV8QPZ8_9BACT
MKPTLLILAAGMASRYGSMKQTEGFGPGGETIMDYSIFNAIRAGFGKVVFIIRKDFADNFKSVFNEKLQGKIEVDYVYQELDSFIPTDKLNTERTKPWGTGHAMLCAKDAVKEPFCVINADDFYGKDAFEKAASFLNNQCSETEMALIGYQLANTLSEHGTVSRGVCEVNEQQQLTTVTERTKIFAKDGTIVYEENEQYYPLAADTKVSMNFWCFHPSIFQLTARLFEEFILNNNHEPKAEFFIPYIAAQFLKNDSHKIHVIGTTSQWFGVTYKEDADGVRESLYALIDAGEYPTHLWS